MAMTLMEISFVFALGLVLGSFYNVVVYRMPRDLSIAKGRSICPNCNTTLKAWDLVPVASWLFLRGKCRYCKSPISLRYPVVELVTALLFLSVYARFGFGLSLVLYASYVSLLLITALIDYEHMVILDNILIYFTAQNLVLILLLRWPIIPHLLGAAVGFGIYFLIYFITKLIYKREVFGFGDVLLLASVGLVAGITQTLFIAGLSFIVSSLYMLVLRVFGKKIKLKEEVPFGPFICFTAYIFMLFGDKLIAMYTNLFMV